MGGSPIFPEVPGTTTSQSKPDKAAESAAVTSTPLTPSSQPLPAGASVSISLASPGPGSTGDGSRSVLSGDLLKCLDDAELLLGYAAEVGLEVGPEVSASILKAHFARHGGIDQPTATGLLSALTQLAAKVRPVTAESLRFCAKYANNEPDKDGKKRSVTWFYSWVAFCLLLVIILLSILISISSSLSDGNRQDVETANALALKLSNELEPPLPGVNPATNAFHLVKPLPEGIEAKDVLKDLQQFAVAIRTINSRTRALRLFTPWAEGTDRLAD